MPKISGDDATFHVDEGEPVPTELSANVRLVGPGAPVNPELSDEPVEDEDLEPEPDDETTSPRGNSLVL